MAASKADLLDLPPEILTGVCQQLDLRNLIRLAGTCKRFRYGDDGLETEELPTKPPVVTALLKHVFPDGDPMHVGNNIFSKVLPPRPDRAATREEVTYQDVAAITPRAMKAGQSLFCKTADGKKFSMKIPSDLPAGMRVTAKVPFPKTVPSTRPASCPESRVAYL